MRLPPSVVSLIESHLLLPDLKAGQTTFRALGPVATRGLSPQIRHTPTRPTQTQGQRLSLHKTISKYPNKPQISLGVAHRILDDHANAPSPSSRTLQLLSRQAIYERIIRTFALAHMQESETTTVTVASIYQRMMEEGVPPNTNTLKIVLGTALKHDMPILPILRQVVEGTGLPEKMDTHLLLLVAKGLVREVGISPNDLELLVDECLSAAGLGEERPVGFDELMIEAYGRSGNLKGIIGVLDQYKTKDKGDGKVSKASMLRLYLQAMSQWTSNPLLRRKRHGSLFPRAIARDMIAIYGTPHDLPLSFLNAWMNGERIAGNTEAGFAVWDIINQPDSLAYNTYFRLLKNSPKSDEQQIRLRNAVKSLLASQVKLEAEILGHALSAAFRHHDLPLALLLARKIDPSVDRHHRHKVAPSTRLIDTLASGLIRTSRQGGLDRIFPNGPQASVPRGEQIKRSEWDMITLVIRNEAAQQGPSSNLDTITLPLSSPGAMLVPSDVIGGNEMEYVGRFKPGHGSQSQLRAGLVAPLIGLLEKAVVALSPGGGGSHGRKDHLEALKDVMRDLNEEILP
jgi:hypothetical protein